MTFIMKCCELSSVASLSHWASTLLVYSTFAMMQRVVWVCQRQLILVNFGAAIPIPSPIVVKFGLQEWIYGMLICMNVQVDQCIVLPLRGKKQWPYFQVQHSALVPPHGTETKLIVGAQLQTFPCQTRSKPFPNSDGLMDILLSQTLPYRSMMDKQTKKHLTFLPCNSF